jgi:hypothetical protein
MLINQLGAKCLSFLEPRLDHIELSNYFSQLGARHGFTHRRGFASGSSSRMSLRHTCQCTSTVSTCHPRRPRTAARFIFHSTDDHHHLDN